MPESIKKRVSDSFPKDAQENLLQYMEWLRASMGDLSVSLRRSVAIILLLASAFELVIGSQKLKISVGSFEISSGSIVLVFIPVIVSYLYLQIMADSFQLVVLQELFAATFDRWSPDGARNKLNTYVIPPLTMYLSIGTLPTYSDKVLNRTQNVLQNLSLGMMMIGVPAFVGIAYWQLFIKHIAHNVPWLISLCIASIWLIAAIAYGLGTGGEQFRE